MSWVKYVYTESWSLPQALDKEARIGDAALHLGRGSGMSLKHSWLYGNGGGWCPTHFLLPIPLMHTSRMVHIQHICHILWSGTHPRPQTSSKLVQTCHLQSLDQNLAVPGLWHCDLCCCCPLSSPGKGLGGGFRGRRLHRR